MPSPVLSPQPMESRPEYVYLDIFNQRIRDAADNAETTLNAGAISQYALILQETETINHNLKRFVTAMDITSINSALFFWTKNWKRRSPFTENIIRANVQIPLTGGDNQLSNAAMILAAERVGQNATSDEIVREFFTKGQCKNRSTFLRGEAALRQGDDDAAMQYFQLAASSSPHVTLAHRRCGEIAWRCGDYANAANHFEAACATPNTSWTLADHSNKSPVLIASVTGWMDFVSYRRRVYAIPTGLDYVGFYADGDDLYSILDSIFFRIWNNNVIGSIRDAITFLTSRLSRIWKTNRHTPELIFESVPPPSYSHLKLKLIKFLFRVHPFSMEHQASSLRSLWGKLDDAKRTTETGNE